MEELNDTSKELLEKIDVVWKKLQQEPQGTHLQGNYAIALPPNQTSYWRNFEELASLVTALSKELPKDCPIALYEFRCTMCKEGYHVKDFSYNPNWTPQKNHDKLAKLMNDANDQIYRDLFIVFQLINELKN